MRTLSKQAIISRDNHRVEFDLPADCRNQSFGSYKNLYFICQD
jgi:hypothetical protein